jgi:hypothetical protein
LNEQSAFKAKIRYVCRLTEYQLGIRIQRRITGERNRIRSEVG